MYSVVIPVYETKKDLERCVSSWLLQTRPDLELILVDDGSADGSGELCDILAGRDKRVKVLHQENTGVSAARNAGIRAASGEYLLFTDSDDYVAADYLEKMSRMQEETDADLVLCGYHHLYDGADILKLPGKTRILKLSECSEDFLSLYENSFLNMPWNKLYRRAWLGQFDVSLSLGEDLLFNLQYMEKCGRIAVLSEPLCYYIQEMGKATLSSQKRKDRLALARRVCTETERFYEKTWGKRHMEGRIFTRYMNEVLDECEKLPSDTGMTYREKLEEIRAYAGDPWVKKRGEEAVLKSLDYRILWFFLKRNQPSIVYELCLLRSLIVAAVHRMRKKG